MNKPSKEGHVGGLTATELRKFQRQLERLNTRGPNRVIDLGKAKLREVSMETVSGQAAVGRAAAVPAANPFQSFSDAELAVWVLRATGDAGLRPLSNRAIGRLLNISEGRVRQLYKAAREKVGS